MKDSQKRTIAKTLTWRVTATITTFLIAWLVFKDDPKVELKASITALIELVLKLIIYYVHERAWAGTAWGIKQQETSGKD